MKELTNNSKRPYYITTPIYYVTDAPHIGHLYCTVGADIVARFHRLAGRDVHFLTGTDEHGQKMQKKAKETGEAPQALADRVVVRYREAWKRYHISHDDFIRTTEERHKKVVAEYVRRLMATGDIYLSEYEGWYCVPDEAYWTETQLVDGKCPDCGRPVEKLKEESYFFAMSKYQDRLLAHIEANPDFITPDTRRNEVLGFVKQGLKDISVSRTTITWGIPFPKDPKATKEHKVYVWFDALTNYVSALNPLEGDTRFAKYWPEAVHLVGKDILRFHAVYWPTFLMALGLPLPKKIVAHGWLTLSNRKISKSLGNAIDPMTLADEVGVDGLRYFLFREFSFGQDGEYTKEVMYRRINADLANDFGNAVSRVTSMLLKYVGEQVHFPTTEPFPEAEGLVETVAHAVENFRFERGLEAIWKLLSRVNRSIDEVAPWTLAKATDDASQKKLRKALAQWHESLRIASTLLLPFIPESAEKALRTLGVTEGYRRLADATWGVGPRDVTLAKPQPLFPRLELPAESP
jgi:methionyl-tRNA synthetase